MTQMYKLGDLNVDILPTNKDKPPPAEFLKKVTFEFPKVVKYGLIHRCSFYSGDKTFSLGILLYSSPLPDRKIEYPVGNLNLVINRFGKVTFFEVNKGESGAYRYL